MVVCTLNNHLNLKRYLVRRRSCSDGGPCMPATLAKYLDEQIRTTVNDFGMLREFRHRVDKPGNLHNAPNSVKRTQLVRDGRKQNDACATCILVSLVNGHVASDFA